jgi:hypothetical protein
MLRLFPARTFPLELSRLTPSRLFLIVLLVMAFLLEYRRRTPKM